MAPVREFLGTMGSAVQAQLLLQQPPQQGPRPPGQPPSLPPPRQPHAPYSSIQLDASGSSSRVGPELLRPLVLQDVLAALAKVQPAAGDQQQGSGA